MAAQSPKLALQTSLEELGNYFNALQFSAFYDLLKDEKSFLGEDASAPFKTTDIASTLAEYLFNATQGGMTISEVLKQAEDGGYKGKVEGDEQKTEVPSKAGGAGGNSISADVFNEKLIFTYEDVGGSTPALNAFTKHQGWSKNKKSNGKHIFSIADITDAAVNENKAAVPTKAKPGLSVTQVFDPMLNVTNHGTTAIQVFLNSIPTLEFSRCVPYLDVQLISGMNPLDKSGRPQTPSLFQFLRGSPETVSDSVDQLIAGARSVNMLETGERRLPTLVTPATSGMELFTSPQTLVSGDEAYNSLTPSNEQKALRSAPVLDRFRPLMSITKFSVDIAPSGNLIAYKTGRMSLVLHDRSRLGEVAQLVKPDLYQKTELLIEYGWSHPEPVTGNVTTGFSVDNAFGAFLNSQRCREKYGVKNSSFNFNEDGSVAIDLELVMKGAMETYTTSIAKGKGVEAAQVEIESLIKAVRMAQKDVNPAYSKDVQGFQMVNSITDTSSVANIDDATLKKLKAFFGKAGKSEALGKVHDHLKGLYGKNLDGKDGLARELETNIARAVSIKQDRLKKGDDPFLRKIKFVGSTKNVSTVGKNQRQYVSLGKLLLIFVGAPLAETGHFDEVQFIFHPFNSQASYMHDFNIAQFPVHIETFVEKFSALKTITANLPLQEFMTFMNKEFISTQDTHAYGLVHTYTGGGNQRKHTDNFKDLTKMIDETTRVMKHAYGKDADATFVMPFVKAILDCGPVNYKIPTEAAAGSSANRTLLRVHFTDIAASSYDGMSKMLLAARDSSLGYINGLAAKSQDVSAKANKRVKHQKQFQDAIELALKEEILEAVPPIVKDDADSAFAADLAKQGGVLRIKGGFPALKRFVSRGVPSIVIGSQNSGVTSAKLSSMNSPELASIMMLQGGPKGGDVAQGARDAGLPLQMSPVELGLETYGCPLFQLAQQFFIDFQTGTNIDNIYTIHGVSHSLSAGEYTTSLKLKNMQVFGQYRTTAASVQDALLAITHNT
jgi:hypothetical protein